MNVKEITEDVLKIVSTQWDLTSALVDQVTHIIPGIYSSIRKDSKLIL